MDIRVGVVGSTGLVGKEIVKCIEEILGEKVKIFCFASSKSAGEVLLTEKKMYKVKELKEILQTTNEKENHSK